MDKIRVNKITVNIDKYDNTIISLYKTNVILGTLTNADLGIPYFSDSGVSIKTYQAYCRDFVIELLNNDGIEGYYYEPKSNEHSQSIKYDRGSFKRSVMEYVNTLLEDKYTYVLIDDRLDSVEKYKDLYIKNSVGEFDIKLTQHNTIITVISEIKSGQLCRPRIIRHNGTDYAFNITSIKRIIKSIQ